MSYCTVRYNGTDQPDHLKKLFRIKTFVLKHGEDVEIPAHIAGMALRELGEKSLTIVSGTPDMSPPVPSSIKEIQRRLARHQEDFPVDPAAALAAIPSLTKEGAALVQGKAETALKAAPAYAGEDRNLAAIAAKMLGKEELAKVLARPVEKAQ